MLDMIETVGMAHLLSLLEDRAAQRLALPAGGRDEITPLWRSQLQAMQTA